MCFHLPKGNPPGFLHSPCLLIACTQTMIGAKREMPDRNWQLMWARRAVLAIVVLCVLYVTRASLMNRGPEMGDKVGLVYVSKDRTVKGMAIESERACPEMCIAVYDPVCASDGVTYSNKCVMSIAACRRGVELKVVSEGECKHLRK